MKLFNKKIISRIAFVILVVMIFQFICPFKNVQATTGSGIGGILFEPVQQLVLTIFDAINWLLHKMFMGSEEILLTASVEKDYSSIFWKFATAVCIAGLGLITFGAGAIAAVALLTVVAVATAVGEAVAKFFGDKVDLPLFSYSPYEIFSNQVPALSVNFFKPITKYTVYVKDDKSDTNYTMKKEDNFDSPAYILRTVIAKWYVTFRNISVVGLLSILVYIGIKITLSAPSEKARYKEMLLNWATAMCMLFILHYGMSIALSITESLSNIVKPEQNAYHVDLTKGVDKDGKEVKKEYKIDPGNGKEKVTIEKWDTNLMGWIRMECQLQTGVFTAFGYTVVYGVLVIYTVMFSITYLKRVVYMAFLTMIAPLIALTYPIDKAGDGKAQAFDSWTKEYIYNLIIQPVHLLLYTMLVSSAAEIVSKNVIYALVVIGFMLPAEKIIRSFFGFKNDKTMGGLNAAVGGAMAIRGLQGIGKLAGKAGNLIGGSGDKKSDKSENTSESDNHIRMADSNNSGEDLTADAYGNNNDENNENNTEETNPDTTNTDVPRPEELENPENPELNPGNGDNPADNPISPEDLEEGVEGAEDVIIGNEFANSGTDDGTTADETRTLDSDLNRHARDMEDQMNENHEEEIRIAANSQEEDKKKKNDRRKLKAKAISRTVGKYALKGAGKGLRLGTKATLGATGATIGIAAGLASDDYSNVGKYAAIGAGTGVAVSGVAEKMGRNVANKGINAVSSVKSQYQQQRDKVMRENLSESEYKDYRNSIADEEFKKDKDAKKFYKESFGEENAKAAMEQALEYRKHGITDNETIAAAMKLENDKYNYGDATSSKRMAIAKMASKVKNEKDVESVKKRLKEKGIKDENIEEIATSIRQMKDLI